MIIAVWELAATSGFAATGGPTNLRTEGHVSPIGIATQGPLLSWQPSEPTTAFQIIVGRSLVELHRSQGSVWDSGRQRSIGKTNATYKGKPLESSITYFWKVKTWSEAGIESDWSSPAVWTTGINKSSEWLAKWISAPKESTAPSKTVASESLTPKYFRKDFIVDGGAKSSYIFYSSFGICELYVNGVRIGSVLDPGISSDSGSVFYRGYDILPLLRGRTNTIGAVVVADIETPAPLKRGVQALLVQIVTDYHDGRRETVSSDETWTVSSDGPLRKATLNHGEHYDARRSEKEWATQVPQAAWKWLPTTTLNLSNRFKHLPEPIDRNQSASQATPIQIWLEPHPSQPIVAKSSAKVRSLREVSPTVFVLDFGEPIFGTVGMRFTAPPGTSVEFRYGLDIDSSSRLLIDLNHPEQPSDSYICRGGEDELWFPRFTLRTFRYISVSGLTNRPPLDFIWAYDYVKP